MQTKNLEKKVFETIKKFKLISKNDRVAVAVSGGKDSMVLLHILNKHFNVTPLFVDLGIENFSQESLNIIKNYCKDNSLDLKVLSFKEEFGFSMQEVYRVLRPGGRVVCLDTSPPPRNLLRPLVVFHLKAVIPALGTLVARDRAAYRYLPASTQAFLPPERLARIMSDAGLEEVSFRSFMLGTIAVLRGRRPPSLEVSH